MIVDVTGVVLIPGNQGRDCPGNGNQPNIECCCDECDYMLYQTNFSAAVHICRLFLRGSVAPPDAETNISRNLVPVRPNRKAPRNANRPRFNGFLYKVA